MSISCDDQIDELSVPEDDVAGDLVFNSETGARAAVNGLYSKMQDPDVSNGNVQAMSEWQSDNVRFVGSFPTFVEVYTYNTLSNNTSINGIWRDSFETIAAANVAIENIPLVEDATFTDAERNQLLGEAKFVRAYVYAQLLDYFAQPYSLDNGASSGLPIVDFVFDGTNNDAFNALIRSTVSEVTQFIITDLTEAEGLLDDSSNAVASKGAAQAMLARIYLNMDDYANAADYATKVIDNGAYALASDYSFYNTTDREWIFTLVNSSEDNGSTNEGFSGLFNPTETGARGDAPFSDYLIALFEEEATDLRYTDLTQTGTDASGISDALFTSKYPDGATKTDNAPLIRISEMYLTRAEANVKAGSSVGDTPDNDVNKIRQRAGLSDLTGVTLDQVLDERRKELCFEGFRRMDLLRNKRSLRPTGDPQEALAAFGADKTIYPIPQNQIDQSEGSITQNPGY